MSDEQQAGAVEPGTERGVVKCGHHRLAGARRRDEEVAVVTVLA